jgi:hypothetical protein
MLPTTLPASASVPNSVVPSASSVDYVLSRTAAEKHAIFMALLREAVGLNGENGLLPIEDEKGESYGYFVPPKAAADLVRRSVPSQTDADQERTRRALESLDDTFTLGEFVK